MAKKTDHLYEKILLEKVTEGDQSSFSVIFTAYYGDLVRYAGTYVRDQDVCEEIVQNTFVDFWENRQSLTIVTSLKAYLLTTVKNRCLDWLRHLKVREQYGNYAGNYLPVLENDTENYILYSELETNLEKALQKLPPEMALAFRMNRQQGLTYTEIAQQQQVSVRTIEVRIGKSLQMLRELLKDYFITCYFIWNFLFR